MPLACSPPPRKTPDPHQLLKKTQWRFGPRQQYGNDRKSFTLNLSVKRPHAFALLPPSQRMGANEDHHRVAHLERSFERRHPIVPRDQVPLVQKSRTISLTQLAANAKDEFAVERVIAEKGVVLWLAAHVTPWRLRPSTGWALCIFENHVPFSS